MYITESRRQLTASPMEVLIPFLQLTASPTNSISNEDHEHMVSLLHMNLFQAFECDVCRGGITQNHCMYYCSSSGCDYGMHVKCVTAKVSVKPPMGEMAFQVEMFKLQNTMKLHQIVLDNQMMAATGLRY
ncbi:hypothetical protein L6452_36016 [Arctium lappa]|uniref:Uncharacterized protein n=1 Tax=Arctium lappa TaxID=4217 RepID=A0ACB8Y876_ARCLA|nr:hypothetical protein L6452_36016 [Arctium lappa]